MNITEVNKLRQPTVSDVNPTKAMMSVEYSISGNKKCRLCLRKTAAYINLFEGNFQQMIVELTSLEISENDGYPTTACISCIDEIQQATKTRRRIIECHKKLVQLHMNQQNINKPEIIVLTDYSDSEDNGVEINQDEGLEEILTYSEVDGLDDLVIKTELTEESNDMTYDVFDDLNTENDVNILEDVKVKDRSGKQYDMTLFNARKEMFPNEKRSRKQDIRKIITDKHYICDECGQDFSNDKYAFNLHKLKHKKSTCKICGIVIRSDNMSKHLDCHTSGPRVCDLCGVTCKNLESLRGHIFYMHRKSADEYKCDQCPRSYRMKYKLEEHKNKEHIGARKHICHICDKKFFTAKDMRSHINMTHKKLRPHKCDHCQKGFSSKYALKTHIRQHTNEAPYKCSICAEGFRQNVSLRTHMKSKHNIEEDKKFPCEFCSKSFISYFALKVHLRLHNDNNYKCDDCQEYFHQKIYLLNHLKNVHNMNENIIDINKFRTNDYEKDESKHEDEITMNESMTKMDSSEQCT
ncbi:zinc finger protein 8-like [Coccinella septempunctata]|uniref:zinc finger protein 8-like n=1 Tax=Coccinella septempunctata TaxID=41139 RepID=UPI001D05E8CE|nr:zinc finger protein 8-like [Coccinella septempunctata]